MITNSPATWAWAMQTLSPEVETLHEAVHRTWPGAFTVSINEPCDAGADYSTFDLLRRGGARPAARAEDLPFATERFVRPVKEYRWASRIDHTGSTRPLDVWGGGYQARRRARCRRSRW